MRRFKLIRNQSDHDVIDFVFIAAAIVTAGFVLTHGVSSYWRQIATSLGLDNYATVEVFYATDRNHLQPVKSIERYGRDRSSNGQLALGVCSVSIPIDHRMGELETPSIWHLEFREDPEKHVVLLSTQQQSYETFYSRLSCSIKKHTRKDC